MVKQFLNAGRNVLCEKPLGLTLAQSREMVQLARDRKVFFMEGIWSRAFPLYRELFSGKLNDENELYSLEK